ncbi:hypothetical protein H6F60_13945, partial [Coleofasciculus sp. FACHB-129]|nr:hypothetical protein [Coleofasciculus sp. FACHB-129]
MSVMAVGIGNPEQKPTNEESTDVAQTERQHLVNAKGTYSQTTERIRSWGKLFKSITPIIWAIVILVVILPLIGQIFITKAFSNSTVPGDIKPPVEVVVKPSVDWTKVDTAMAQALKNAYASAESYASKELDVWIDELMVRVDSSFLGWYFGYFNQKHLEYKSLFVQLSSGAAHLLNSNSSTSEEKVAEVITKDFQTEFAKRVLLPQTSQLRLERLTQQTVKYYLDELSGNINNISISYKIPQADWNRYLNETAITINDSKGQISNLSLKVLAGGG